MTTDSLSRQQPQSWHQHAAQHAGNAHAQRPASQPAYPEPEFKAKLLADWQLVKRARFHAADRLDRRNTASLWTLSTVALYGGLVTVFVLIFKDSLTPHMRNICDWVSVVANWLTLTFSLTEQIKDYSGQSRALHECGQRVNDLRKHLLATPISAPQQLVPFVKEYEAIISECGPNHNRMDFEIARLEGSRSVDGMTHAEQRSRLRQLRVRNLFATHTIYVVMMAAPAVAGFLAWLLVAPPAAVQ